MKHCQLFFLDGVKANEIKNENVTIEKLRVKNVIFKDAIAFVLYMYRLFNWFSQEKISNFILWTRMEISTEF